ncbi:MAG: acetylornithine transaminase [Bacillota bacterium]
MTLFDTYARWPVRAVRGEKHWLWDESGRRYLDFTSGIGVTNLGHVPEAVKQAVAAQLEALWHCSNFFHIPLQERLAEKLCTLSGLDRAFFCNSGAEANEAAIKLARRYFQVVKGEKRYEVVTFHRSFHGRTLATLTATGQEKVKTGFAPLPEGFRSVPYGDLAALEAAVTDNTAAVMLELVLGEGGVVPAEPAFVRGVAELCRRRDLLFIVDEVQTGLGRTGTLFAFQQYGVVPDVVTLAKGLGSGLPVGAMLAKAFLSDAFGPGSHGTTFGGNPVAMAAALATLEELERGGWLERVRAMGALLKERLAELATRMPAVVEVRGLGLMLGVQVTVPVADVLAALRRRGVLMLPAGTDVIRLLPPFTIGPAEVEVAVRALAEALDEVAAQGGDAKAE